MKKVVYLDHYDSFADTIAAYFKMAGAEVKMYKSDCDLDIICREEPDLILLGPGPKSPTKAGNYLEALERFHKEHSIFGVCLGFQAMMHYFGQEVVELKELVHGASSPIVHDGKGIFEDIESPAEFARYHSLGVYEVPDCFQENAYHQNKEGEHIVMAASHRTLPIEGVQFHPESVISTGNDQGMRLIENVVRYL